MDSRPDLRDQRLQKTGGGFPPKIDLTALSLGHERSRRERAHSLDQTRGFRPTPQRGIREQQRSNDVWILRIEFADLLVAFETLLPFSLTPLDRGNQYCGLAVVRRQSPRGIELGQRCIGMPVEHG